MTRRGAGSRLPARDELQDFALLREAVELELREEELAVDGDLEPAAVARDERERGEPALERLEQSSRQTGGLGLVVSHRAVLDLDLHRGISSPVPLPQDPTFLSREARARSLPPASTRSSGGSSCAAPALRAFHEKVSHVKADVAARVRSP
jgi:hypothetical protein